MPHSIDSQIVEGLNDIKSLRTQATVQNTVAGTLPLVLASEMVQIFDGTVAGQIVKMPDATTLSVGHRFEIWNLSTQTIDVKNYTPTTLFTLLRQRKAWLVLKNNTTSAGVWAYSQSDVDPGRQTSGVVPPFIFSYTGVVNSGIYLRTGSVPTSDTGQVIKGDNYITEIQVANKQLVPSNQSPATIQFQRRTDVSTFVDITGASVTLTTGQYKGSSGLLSIPIGTDWELACYCTAGSVSSPVVVLYVVPQ